MTAQLPIKKNLQKGQALIGILIAIGVFAILMHALFTLVTSSYHLVSFNKSRITARHIAQEKMELIRNLAYDDVGTVGGIPSGVVEPTETVLRNDLEFEVNTTIIYIDNSYDQLAPNDTFPTDYKRARVEVNWGGAAASKDNPVVLITDVAPKSTISAYTGTLDIQVVNANGEPVPQANVTIVATSVSPPVNTTLLTDDDGKVTLPGAIPCDTCYEITVTKEGYSQDKTYGTSEVANPDKPHASVIESQVTNLSFSIDLLASLNITTYDSRENNFDSIGDIDFILRGNKTIGTDTGGGLVYKYEEAKVTDSGGSLVVDNLEWDSYEIFTDPASSWDIAGTNPIIPVAVLPQSSTDLAFTVQSKTSNSLLITVKDTSQQLLEDATVRLYDIPTSYDEATTSGKLNDPDYGQVFFPDLQPISYSVEATASGYTNYNNNFNVSGYSKEEIIMSP